MEFINKITGKITKTTIESDAIPASPRNPTTNRGIPENRIPSVNIEEVSDSSVDSRKGNSSPIISDPGEDTPPVPPRRKKSKPKCTDNDSDPDDEKATKPPSVHTQATGNVVNIVNSSGVHVGPSVQYVLGKSAPPDVEKDESSVPKTKGVTAVMKSKDKISHEHMDILSQNLGAGWRRVFRKLGYADPMLDTFYESHQHKGVSEVIYKLLLDWTRTGQRTLGELCTVTWKEGKRYAVSQIANLYKKSDKSTEK